MVHQLQYLNCAVGQGLVNCLVLLGVLQLENYRSQDIARALPALVVLDVLQRLGKQHVVGDAVEDVGVVVNSHPGLEAQKDVLLADLFASKHIGCDFIEFMKNRQLLGN